MDVKRDSFQTQSQVQGTSIVVCMRGNADMDAQEPLRAFLEGLHQEVKRRSATQAVFELQDLYFMNSSCLSLLLRHVNAVMEAPTAQKYRLTFRSNPNLRWQKKSLQALQSYAPDIVSVE